MLFIQLSLAKSIISIILTLKFQLFENSEKSETHQLFENGDESVDKQSCHTLEASKLVEYDMKKTLTDCVEDLFGKGMILMRANKTTNKSSLFSRYYAEACNEWPGPSPQLGARVAQFRRNVASVAGRWRHCADLTGPGIEPKTFHTDSVCFTTELMREFHHILYLAEHDSRCCGF